MKRKWNNNPADACKTKENGYRAINNKASKELEENTPPSAKRRHTQEILACAVNAREELRNKK